MTENKTRAAVLSRPALVAGLLVVAGLTGCSGDTSAESGAPSSPATSTDAFLAMPAGSGDTDEEIEPGRYRIPSSEWSAVDFTVTFPKGWTVQYGHVYHQAGEDGEVAELYAIDLESVYTDACHGEGVPRKLGPGVDDLVAALLAQEGPAVGEPVSTTLGGHPATRLDLSVPRGLDLGDCRLADDGVLGLQLWHSEAADKYFVLQGTAHVYVLDVDGERQVFVTQQVSPKPADRAGMQAVLDSIRFA